MSIGQQVDHYVDITEFSGVPAGDRAEEPWVRRAVSMQYRLKFVTTRCEELEHCERIGTPDSHVYRLLSDRAPPPSSTAIFGQRVFGRNDAIVVKRRTDASGKYLVEGLPAGTVRISYDPTELPLGYVPSSDLNGTDAFSTVASLTAGATRLDVDFVVIGSATLNVTGVHIGG